MIVQLREPQLRIQYLRLLWRLIKFAANGVPLLYESITLRVKGHS